MTDLVTHLQILTVEHVVRRALGAKPVHHRLPPAKLRPLATAIYLRLLQQGWTPPPIDRPVPRPPIRKEP